MNRERRKLIEETLDRIADELNAIEQAKDDEYARVHGRAKA